MDYQKYIQKNTDPLSGKDIEFDLRQIWHHRFDVQTGLKEKAYYINSHNDKLSEVMSIRRAILTFLYSCKMASRHQLVRYCKILGFDGEKVKKVLDGFVTSRVLNAFVLANYDLVPFPEDAELFYTLDYAGVTILDHFGATKPIEWRRSEVEYGFEKIKDILQVNQFLLSVYETFEKKDVVFIETFKSFDSWKGAYEVASDFRIRDLKGGERDFILQVYCNEELPLSARNQAERTRLFYGSKSISQYFKAPPVLIISVEEEKDLLEVARIYDHICPEVTVRYITEDSIKDGFKERSFYGYNRDLDQIQQAKVSLFIKRG